MSKKDDLDRLEELKLRVFGTVARNYLNKSTDPLVILKNDIEHHGGRVTKAIRLLKEAGVIHYVGTQKTKYSSDETYAVDTFDRDSRSYGVAPKFKTKWLELLDETKHSYLSSQEDADTIGYYDVDNLSHSDVIDVYHHQKDYNIQIIKKEARVYPQADLEELRRQILKSVVENRFQEHFREKLTQYLGLPENSFKDEEQTLSYYRQFAYHSVSFTPEHYKNFLEEYTHHKTYFEAMIHQINKTLTLIEDKGGHEVIIKEMRKQAIKDILEESPLMINYEEPENSSTDYSYYTNLQELHNKFLNLYIVRNSRYLDYDYLYGDDTSLIHIGNRKIERDKMETFTLEENDHEHKVIEAYQKDQKECMKKSILNLCIPILKNA